MYQDVKADNGSTSHIKYQDTEEYYKFMASLSENILAATADISLSQSKLAKELGISRVTWSKISNFPAHNTKKPIPTISAFTVWRISKLSKWSIEQLFSDDYAQNNPSKLTLSRYVQDLSESEAKAILQVLNICRRNN